MNKNIYQKNGYIDRNDYLLNLADDFGLDFFIVCALAEALGESEDFDGLICELEDAQMLMGYRT